MPKIIVTSRYMKPDSHAHIENYVKYIGTREGTEIVERNVEATEGQANFIGNLIKDFPKSKNLPEYEKYLSEPNSKNASECISAIIDDNMDLLVDRKIYMTYLGTRPNVVRVGSHGLFSETDDPIVLTKVAREVAEHKGNVWTHVISLRRVDAERMGYTTLTMWRDLVKRHLDDIAAAQKIDRSNLKWYAAFHDKENNPHVHIVVYSQNIKEGYLTSKGIEKIRGVFANDIYRDELQNLYQKQTIVRDMLRSEAGNHIKNLAAQLNRGEYSNPTLENLIIKLSEQLKTANGKKVYGYLQPNIKQTVDEIVTELAKNPVLKKMYTEWCALQQEKYQMYSSTVKKFPSLAENKVFKPIKNMVIDTVLNMEFTLNTADCEQQEQASELSDIDYDEPVQFDDIEQHEEILPQRKYYIKWSKEYIAACNALYREQDIEKALAAFQAEANKGNILAIYDIGKMYRQDLIGDENAEKADKYFEEALCALLKIEPSAKKMQPYVQYRIGKLYNNGYGTAQDYNAAFDWFEKSAAADNKYAQYSLGCLYYYGNGTEQNFEKAFHWYRRSADKGNAYSCYETAKMLCHGEGIPFDRSEAERYFKKAYNGFMKIEQDMADDKLWYRLGMMALNGVGCEIDIVKAVNFLEKSAKLNNENALCVYGKLLTEGKIIQQNIERGIEMLEKSAKKSENAQYYLGKLYLFGREVERDIEKAVYWLKLSSDSGNEYAKVLLNNIDRYRRSAVKSVAVSLLSAFGKLVTEDYNRNMHSRPITESKLKKAIRRKKLALGIKDDRTVEPKY